MFTNQNLMMIFLAMLVLIFCLKTGMFGGHPHYSRRRGKKWRRRKLPKNRRRSFASRFYRRGVASGEGMSAMDVLRYRQADSARRRRKLRKRGFGKRRGNFYTTRRSRGGHIDDATAQVCKTDAECHGHQGLRKCLKNGSIPAGTNMCARCPEETQEEKKLREMEKKQKELIDKISSIKDKINFSLSDGSVREQIKANQEQINLYKDELASWKYALAHHKEGEDSNHQKNKKHSTAVAKVEYYDKFLDAAQVKKSKLNELLKAQTEQTTINESIEQAKKLIDDRTCILVGNNNKIYKAPFKKFFRRKNL